MTPDQALSLTPNQTIYHASLRNRDGTALLARVNGKPVIKKRSNTWRIPLKHGLKTFFNLDPRNVNDWLIKEPSNETR